MILTTDRLILRPWEPRDRAPFAAMNADAEVMRYFPAPRTRQESDALLDKLIARAAEKGFSFAAVERRSDGTFAGMVGLNPVLQGPLTGAVEVGWSLPRIFWGMGLASEAARAWLDHGFGAMNLDEIVAFTATDNHASRRVMERIGMARRADLDFDHPALPEGHPLRPHVVYAARRA
ncbi:N-acetyltransferase [Haematobacter massiliensis]|uniref:GCN5 family acetyltransferase n=1 Tax=Haematobacter massiliensis TaxID=195105 RepID=A0A086YCZ6_9RHOB|nr:GNAT family N-acetyltransferase [Haematobacter massiliensis]KFI32146.1 GCN5 family acetyltransferase [Haematobacter massiliensis]OWJ72740.1 N-acetyltransferase [Haematobacter massiliensis]OWJ85784.1 N-acetyltransferase [Haematobacter massiliensis]QBJ24525.1 N-acetyltransferase [Haematobacter massiliensis]